jgi:hypothetical protein
MSTDHPGVSFGRDWISARVAARRTGAFFKTELTENEAIGVVSRLVLTAPVVRHAVRRQCLAVQPCKVACLGNGALNQYPLRRTWLAIEMLKQVGTHLPHYTTKPAPTINLLQGNRDKHWLFRSHQPAGVRATWCDIRC